MKISGYIPFYKRNLHLAYPVVLSQIGQVTVHLVDNMMVGHVGTSELAASSFANNVFMIGMYFGMGVTYGLTPLVGKAFGNGKPGEVVKWFKNGFFTHLSAAFVLTCIMFGLYLLLPFMGQTNQVLKLARPYYLLLCFSYLPFMVFFSLKQFFEGIGNTKIAMFITLSANVINVVLNYLLIFGKLGFPEIGLNGAGVGTLIARLSMAVFFISVVAIIPKFKRYFTLSRYQPFRKKEIILLLKIGIPIAFQLIVEVTAFGIGAVMMGWLGEISLAAHQVALGMASFTYMISLGISQANTIRVSHQMGVGDYGSMKKAALASTHLVLLFMSVMAVIFVLGRHILPLMFTVDPAVIQVASALLIIAAIFQVFDGLQVVMLSTLRGMADVKTPMIYAFIAYLLIGIPVSYMLTFVFEAGPQGIWLGYLVGLGIAGVLFYFRFLKKYRELRTKSFTPEY